MISMDKEYRTRGGEGVRIYSLDAGGERPVHGARWDEESGEWFLLDWTANGRVFTSDYQSPFDLIEVQTAEDVVRETLTRWRFTEFGRGNGPEKAITKALRDAGKLRDGE